MSNSSTSTHGVTREGSTTLSIVIPARNEAAALQSLLPALRKKHPTAEIVVVNDASVDATASLCREYSVRVIDQPYRMGNGAAIKAGAREANGDVLIFMDADGQHDPTDVEKLLDALDQGYDMVVGARRTGSQANWGRGIANRIYNWLASYMTGQHVQDLTSGFRAVRAERFREFLHLLPNGFSYPTTTTMAFFRAGYPVCYLPITAARRQGQSHLRPVTDGIRFLLIIFKVATLYSPLKIFAPLGFGFFGLGLTYYIYTFFSEGRFTNMSALLFTTSVLIFLIGLVSEQITTLLYAKKND